MVIFFSSSLSFPFVIFGSIIPLLYWLLIFSFSLPIVFPLFNSLGNLQPFDLRTQRSFRCSTHFLAEASRSSSFSSLTPTPSLCSSSVAPHCWVFKIYLQNQIRILNFLRNLLWVKCDTFLIKNQTNVSQHFAFPLCCSFQQNLENVVGTQTKIKHATGMKLYQLSSDCKLSNHYKKFVAQSISKPISTCGWSRIHPSHFWILIQCIIDFKKYIPRFSYEEFPCLLALKMHAILVFTKTFHISGIGIFS